MKNLKGYQRKYLKGLAHGLKPIVFIGQKGFTSTVAQAVDEALEKHELIKVKFQDFKEKDQKKELVVIIEEKAVCEMVGMIGHTAIFFRKHHDPEKQKIIIPEKPLIQ